MQKEKAVKAREAEPLICVKLTAKTDAKLPETLKERTGFSDLSAGSAAIMFVTRAELDALNMAKSVKVEVPK